MASSPTSRWMRPDCSTDKSTLRHFVIAALTTSLAITLLAEQAMSQPDATEPTAVACGVVFSRSPQRPTWCCSLRFRPSRATPSIWSRSRLLQGEFWLDTLRVWMQTRDYCRPPADDFPAGGRWIMALSQIQEVPDRGLTPPPRIKVLVGPTITFCRVAVVIGCG